MKESVRDTSRQPGSGQGLFWLILAIWAVGSTAGCLSRPSFERQFFSFAVPPAAAEENQAERVLRFRRVEVTPPYDGQSLVYRTGEYSFEQDPYAQFLNRPDENIGAALKSCFRKAGVFGRVAEAGSLLRADTFVEVYVKQLYGDFRDREEPAAVLAIRFVFFAGSGGSERPLLDKEYTRRIPLPARTAAAVVEGWNEGLRQIVEAAAADFSKTKF